MDPLSEPALAEEEQAHERGLEEEGEGSSIASVWAIMSPVALEKAAQLVPNWNSSGMPVTTPITKVMAKILPQNRAATLYSSSRLRM